MGILNYVGPISPLQVNQPAGGWVNVTTGGQYTFADSLCVSLMTSDPGWFLGADSHTLGLIATPTTNPLATSQAAALAPSQTLIFANTTSAGFTISLPNSVGLAQAGQAAAPYVFKNVGTANLLTVTGFAGQTIDGNASVTVAAAANLTVVSDGANWRIIGSGGTTGGSGGVTSFNGRTGTVTPGSSDYTNSQISGSAPTASPALTGTPTAPTASPLTNDTQIATTAYADAAVTAAGGGGGTTLQTFILGSVTGAQSVNLANELLNEVSLTLTGNVTVTVSGIAAGAQIIFDITQDSSGGHTFSVSTGTAIQVFIPTAASSRCRVDAVSVDGSTLDCTGPAGGVSVLTTSGTYTIPTHANVLEITCVGGGGSGCAGSTSATAINQVGGGGGGPGAASTQTVNVGTNATLTIGIGAGGAQTTGAVAGGTAGTANYGNDTTVTGSGSPAISVTGRAGNKGTGGAASSAAAINTIVPFGINTGVTAGVAGMPGTGGVNTGAGGPPSGYHTGGGGAGGNATATLGGTGGNAGTAVIGGAAGANGGSASATGTTGAAAGANTGAGGGGGGAGAAGTGAGGNGGAGGSGFVVIKVVG